MPTGLALLVDPQTPLDLYPNVTFSGGPLLSSYRPSTHRPALIHASSPLPHFISLPGTDHLNTWFSLLVPPPARASAPSGLALLLFCSCLYSQPSGKCLAQSRGSTTCAEGFKNKKVLAQFLTPRSCSVHGTTAALLLLRELRMIVTPSRPAVRFKLNHICRKGCRNCQVLCKQGRSVLITWRRQWHPTPVLLPGKSHGRRSLVGCSPWGR